MKFSRSVASGILGALLFLALVALGMLIIDERLSRQLDDIELTLEEMMEQ